MITPHKKPPNGELSEAAEEANKRINRIRQVVERTIAHIKSWRIHPHRLPPPPAQFEQTITAALSPELHSLGWFRFLGGVFRWCRWGGRRGALSRR